MFTISNSESTPKQTREQTTTFRNTQMRSKGWHRKLGMNTTVTQFSSHPSIQGVVLILHKLLLNSSYVLCTVQCGPCPSSIHCNITMKFPIVSYILQGLATQDSMLKLKRFLGDMRPSCQVLCVQEHKLRRGPCIYSARKYGRLQHSILPQLPMDNTLQNNDVLVGCGGSFIAIAPKLVPYIIQHDTILDSEGVWIHLQHPEFGQLGIANIYAPNSQVPYITL